MNLAVVVADIETVDTALIALLPELRNVAGIPAANVDEIEKIAQEVHSDLGKLKGAIDETSAKPTLQHIVSLVEDAFALVPAGVVPFPWNLALAVAQGLLPAILHLVGAAPAAT